MDTVELIVAAASARGVREVAITEHLDRFAQAQFLQKAACSPYEDLCGFRKRWWGIRMTEDLDGYVDLLLKAKQRGFPVLLGIEADYIPGTEAEIARLLGQYPFDLVLGSVHWVGGWGIGLPEQRGVWEEKDASEVYGAYYSLVSQALQTSLFDVLTHPDLVKSLGYLPAGPQAGYWEQLVSDLRRSSVVAEVSTAGWRKPIREIYPHQGLLHLFRGAGVPITLASDAHCPDHIGYRFAEIRSLLKSIGYTTVTRFSSRRRSRFPL